jgi:hypothetical protein
MLARQAIVIAAFIGLLSAGLAPAQRSPDGCAIYTLARVRSVRPPWPAVRCEQRCALTFTADGTFSGFCGPDHWSGHWEWDGKRVTATLDAATLEAMRAALDGWLGEGASATLESAALLIRFTGHGRALRARLFSRIVYAVWEEDRPEAIPRRYMICVRGRE